MQRTIEQLICIAVANIKLSETDFFFFNSLVKQLGKNLSLTHKQYDLAKNKLESYRSLFIEKNIDDFDLSLLNVQMPLRTADKEKTIRLAESETDQKKYFIEIKFPFNKKEIKIIESLKKLIQYKNSSYYKKNNCHYFSYNEDNVYQILTAFLNRNFIVDEQINEVYEKIKFIKDNPQLYVPGIYGNKIANIHKSTEFAIVNELGELTESNSIKFLDRKLRFGLEKIELADNLSASIETYSPCAIKIASRATCNYLSKPDEEKLEDLLNAIVELDRFPLLVVLSDQISPATVLDQIKSVHGFFEKIIGNATQSVLFRLDTTTDSTSQQFNSYIKEHQLNNWVDQSTKLVYINYNSLPKVILKSNWKPIASLSFSNLNRSYISTYTDSICDLNIIREKDFSIINQYKKNK